MKTALLALSALAASAFAATLAGCSSSSSTPSIDDGDVARSEQGRLTNPNLADGDATALRDGNTAFAAALYQKLGADPAMKDENLFFSPHSISLALSMTFAGAKGETATQMATALHYTLPSERLHPAFDALDLALSSRGQGAKGDDGTAFRLRVTNSTWGAPETAFAPPFLDTLAQYYGADVRLTDFQADPEAARGAINHWVDQQTEDRIQQLLPSGAVDRSTRLVLVDAVYFNAAWATPFMKEATHTGTFHGLAGDQPVDLMSQAGEMAYAKGQGWQSVTLPYDGDGLSFIAVLPDDLASFEQGLTGDEVTKIATSGSTAEVNLTLPKFTIKGASFSLKNALGQLGMTDAFSEGADFSGMTSSGSLHLGDVYHQAFISVDEAGTEAAAATSSVMAGSAAPSNTVQLTLDRPFVFFVRDDATGAVVFMGRFGAG